MLKNIFKRLFRLSTLLISFELIYAPLAISQTTTQSPFGGSSNSTASIVMQGALTLGQTYIDTMNQQNSVQNVEGHKNNLQGLRPVQADPSQVPPLFSGCVVYAAEETSMVGLSCSEVALEEQDLPPGARRGDTGYFTALYEVALENKATLSSASTQGANRFSSQGETCYNKKEQEFTGAFKVRREELSKIRNALTLRVQDFKAATQNDLVTIEKNEALLSGKPEKYLKDVKFDQLFIEPAGSTQTCGSLVDGSVFQRAGEGGGLRGIEDLLFQSMSKQKNANSLSANEAITKRSQMEKDVDDLAAKIASQSKIASGADSLRGLTMDVSSISTNTGVITQSNGALKRISDNFNNDVVQEINKQKEDLRIDTVAGSSPQAGQFIDAINSNLTRFEDVAQELKKYENQTVGTCLQDYIISNNGSIENFVSKFQDPNVSDNKNDNADNAFKNYIANIITNASSFDIQDLISELESEQNQGGNGRYIMTTGKSVTIRRKIGGQFQTKKINASTRLQPAAIVGIFAENCRDQFEHSETNGISQRETVDNIKAYSKIIDRKRQEASSKILSAVKSELKDCPSDTSTGKAALSCTNALDKSSSNFCIRTAIQCANNAKACHDRADKTKDTINQAQAAIATNYNTQVESLKVAMKTDLLALNTFLENQARTIDGQFSMGTVYNVPEISFDITSGKNILEGEGYDPALKLEDPEKFLEKALDQIKILEASLLKHEGELLKEIAKVKTEYIKNYKKQVNHWDKIAKECKREIQNQKSALAQEQQRVQEENSEISQTCAKINAFNKNPQGFCGQASSLAEDVLKATGSGDSYSTLMAYESNCNGGNATSTNPFSVTVDQVKTYCGRNKGTPGCKEISGIDTDSNVFNKFTDKWCYDEYRKKFPASSEKCSPDSLRDITFIEPVDLNAFMKQANVYTKDYATSSDSPYAALQEKTAESLASTNLNTLGQQSDTRIAECQATPDGSFTQKGTGDGSLDSFFEQAAGIAGRTLATQR